MNFLEFFNVRKKMSKKVFNKKYVFIILILYVNVIIGVNGLNEIFKLENINLEYNANDFVVWRDTSNNGNNNHVIIKSEYQGINDNINGYCASSQDITPIRIPINISPNPYPNLTLIAWVYQTTIPLDFSGFMLSNDNGGWDRQLIVHLTICNGVAAGVGYTYQSSIGYFSPFIWGFVAAVYTDSGTATIYKGQNGILSQQVLSYDNTNNGVSYFYLNGSPEQSAFKFIGCIGQVEIYSDALNQVDIQERFHAMTRSLTINPTNSPTMNSNEPTYTPTIYPSDSPTIEPSNSPSNVPTNNPTEYPTNYPTNIPTDIPTYNPTVNPSQIPTNLPTIVPTITPSIISNDIPTNASSLDKVRQQTRILSTYIL